MNSDKKICVNYEKRKNAELFNSFQKTDIVEMQNYIPIYNKNFLLNETNYNSLNLNNQWYLTNIKNNISENKNLYNCIIQNKDTSKIKQKKLFFKMAPLLDPFKYLIGKYNLDDLNIFKLPKFNNEETYPKINNENNCAYVDGFFSFLSSLLIYKHDFINGVDYYGSFLGIKQNFSFNIIDDLDYLCKSDFFNKNKNIKFQVDEYQFLFNNEDKKLNPIKIDYSTNKSLSAKSIQEDLFEDIFDISEINNSDDLIDLMDSDLSENNTDITKIQSVKSNSSCSSRTSHTSNDSDSNSTNSQSDEEEEWEDEISEEFDDNLEINATIPQIPIQVICMEY